MARESALPRLTDMISVKHERSSRPPDPRPTPGTHFTATVETIDNDHESWFLGVLPPA